MRKKLILTMGVLAALTMAAIGTFCFIFFAGNTRNTERTTLIVPHDATYAQLTDSLRSRELLRHESTFNIVVRALRFKTMRPGKYTIEPRTSNYHLVRLLRAGQRYPVRFSFNNIRTVDQLVAKTEGVFFFDTAELQTLLHDTAYLAQYGLTEATLPAVFIPNSYEFYYDISAEDFFKKMMRQHKKFWTLKRLKLAQEIGLTPFEVATLASIVEEENFRPSEKAIIAGLYINRLRKGMLLQSDPTVKFALGDFTRQRILNTDLEVESPYNTYKYPGLPPGPIRIAEASTIDSVLHYRQHNYLYMCAKEDLSGYHNFTSSAAVHAQNAARYRAALNRRNIKK